MRLIKSILRNFKHNRLYTFINMIGLAVGLSCFTYILLYVQNEISFDQHHSKHERIFRLDSDITISDKNQQVAKTSFAIGPAIMNEFPEVEDFVRFRSVDNSFLRFDNKKFYEDWLYFTDSSIFRVFDHQFIEGDPKIALSGPNKIVLTESISKKYFGNVSAMGEVISINNQINCKVTAVIKDVPKNSHLKFDALISMESYSQIIGNKMYNDLNQIHFWAIRLFTYVLLNDKKSMDVIHSKFPDFNNKYIADISKRLNGEYNLLSTRLDKIHLYSERDWDLPLGNKNTVFIFSIIAMIILLIAGINYMNLATAKSTHKAKEVGIRKVLGSQRKFIAIMFLVEAVLLALISLIFSLMIVETFLPYFNELSGKNLDISINKNPILYITLLTITIMIGLLSGSYPAFYLSSFIPVKVLNGVFNPSKKNSTLRKLLIIFQFTISIVMISCTLIVFQQMRFIKNQHLGFKKENVVILRSADTTFKKHITRFKETLLSNPNIYNVSTSNLIPGQGLYLDVFLVEGTSEMEEQLINYMTIDYNFIDLMGMKLLKGRIFNKDNALDSKQAAIINWNAAKKLGWKDNALHKNIHQRSYETIKYKVVGVLEDFNFTSLHDEIEPIIFLLEESPGDFISIRINPKNTENTLAYIENIWQDANPMEPYKYDFLDKSLDTLYESDNQLQKIITFFALLSIFISLMGLFGLSSFITEKYSKNIGIRKLLGASIGSLVYLLSKDFLRLIIISLIIAIPLAWLIMDNWLQTFAFHIEIQFIWFALIGLFIITIAQLTVIIQTVTTALANPAEVIKYE